MLFQRILATALGLFLASPALAVLTFDDDVTPDAIFGSGNANGGWTISRENGIELGMRAKLRYNSMNQPENTFNYSGTVPVGTGMVPYGLYQFQTGSAAGDFDRPVWNFEFSINTDVDGSTGKNLNDLTYFLNFQTVSGGSVNIPFGDVINTPYADHSIGTNATGNGDGTEASSTTEYATLIDENNVAQQSWNIDFFTDDFDPFVNGEYRISLSAFDPSLSGSGFVGQAAIVVQAIPEPSAILFGSLLAGSLGLTVSRRRRQED